MTIEKLIKQIMDECAKDGEPVTEDEARQMAEMEIKSKGIRRYEKSEESLSSTKPKTPRPRKEDEEKRMLINLLNDALIQSFEPIVTNPEREITFKVNGNEYSVTLIKHRPPKT